jgi:hypothetical protein
MANGTSKLRVDLHLWLWRGHGHRTWHHKIEQYEYTNRSRDHRSSDHRILKKGLFEPRMNGIVMIEMPLVDMPSVQRSRRTQDERGKGKATKKPILQVRRTRKMK